MPLIGRNRGCVKNLKGLRKRSGIKGQRKNVGRWQLIASDKSVKRKNSSRRPSNRFKGRSRFSIKSKL